jgi:hypothetical protein
LPWGYIRFWVACNNILACWIWQRGTYPPSDLDLRQKGIVKMSLAVSSTNLDFPMPKLWIIGTKFA